MPTTLRCPLFELEGEARAGARHDAAKLSLCHHHIALLARELSCPENTLATLVEELLKVSFKIATLARTRSLSPRQLERSFQETFSHSPRQVALTLRTTLAWCGARNTSKPLKVVASDLGFPHPAHFSRSFRLYHGLPASELRRATGPEATGLP